MKKHLVSGLCLSVLAIGIVLPKPLRALTVNSADIAPADSTSGQVLTTGKGVKTGHIQNLAVTGSKIAAGTITTGKIGNSQITNDLLGSGAVTDAKISGVISAGKLPVGTTAGTVAAGDHGHNTLYQKKYANIVVVAKSGGDYTDPISAMNSITDASWTNPYLVKIMPGVYDLGSDTYLPMKEGVDVEGSGRTVTRITGNGSGGYHQALGMVRWDSGCGELRALTVESSGSRETLSHACMVRNASIIAEQNCINKFGGDAHIEDVDMTCGFIGLNQELDPSGTFYVERTQISASFKAVNLVNGGSAVFNNVEVTTPYGPGIFIHTSHFEASNSKYIGGYLGIYWGSVAVLNNVIVDSGSALAVEIQTNGVAQMYGGRYVGDILSGLGGGDLKAVGVRFAGTLNNMGTATITNCVDGSFAPIPNIPAP